MRKRITRFLNKLISISMCSITVFYSLFGYLLIDANAEEYNLLKTTSQVALRSKPTTDANEDGSDNRLMWIDDSTIVKLLESEKVSGNGCNDGWYKISYNNNEGYICSTYTTTATSDSYERPWTTPKKAIVGGAKFISKGYISKGQNTSYLKKFNVIPNGYYNQFAHQYMANLAAPSSEASTSYKTYNANGLLTLPLEFSIPVFNNMDDNYNRPGSNLAEIEFKDEVTDQEFENRLDDQGFPESYKRILRKLHDNHPNWIFNSLNTNTEFATVVSVEQTVSSIQGEIYRAEGNIQTEPGWYFANSETVAYYLDPRNFLTEKYILQFENLGYSDNYTEEVVQTVLNNTFMQDISIIDNQSYASIFVEAGKTANISPVYLASLAKQESGSKGGSNTSGAAFEYEGTNYSGLYNFFNIGAFSSASNPSKAGLVYASGGYCTLCDPSSVPNIVVTEVPPVSNIENLGAKLKNNYLVGFEIGVSTTSLTEKDSTITYNNNVIGTGTIAHLNDGTEYTIVLYGDLTGTGNINSADLLRMRKHLLGTEPLTGAYLEAAELTGDDTINSADLLKMRQYLLGTAGITQG